MMEFIDFMDLTKMADGDLELVCESKNAAQPEKGWVPWYVFNIVVDGEIVGQLDLRIGMTEGLQYSGQIGYIVKKEHRGKGYAARAVKLLVPVLRFHKMDKALICTEKGNISSNYVCEKIGAKLIDVRPTPQWHDTYDEGWRTTNIYEWGVVE
ncbi:MAG: GNAT family N-acetyltransferase [Defluviitaleaceae bacterium]|nr:GNAT family N-acetyltransferase [Defluviitaleaceae bacterium]